MISMERKKLACLRVQSLTKNPPPSCQGNITHDHRRAKQVLQAQLYTGDGIAQPIQPRRILHRDQRQSAIEFVHAGRKDTADRETAQARQHADGSGVALRDDNNHRISDLDAKLLRECAAQHDAVTTWNEILERTRAHVRTETSDLPIVLGSNAAHQRATDVRTVHEHSLILDIWRGCSDRGHFLHPVTNIPPFLRADLPGP